MTIARTVRLGLGIMFVLGVGAVSLSRAQQAGDKAATPGRARSELRERVLTLRTEVDLLQLEIDADRAELLDSLKEMRQAAKPGNDDLMMQMMAVQLSLREDAEALKKMSEMSEGGMKKLLAKAKGDLSKDVDRRKKEFAMRTRFLNEKKLELEETEAKYWTASKD
jgi:hypothetical protein